MRLSIVIFISVFTIAISSCRPAEKEVSSYHEIPTYMRSFLDTFMGKKDSGVSWIAEKNEPCRLGCVVSRDQPDTRFVSASYNKERLKLIFLIGGIAGVKERSVTVYFKNDKPYRFKIGDMSSGYRELAIKN